MLVATRVVIACLLATAGTLIGCRGDEIVSVNDRVSTTVSVVVGQELQITLGTVGPGAYESPPSISSPAVRFLDVSCPTTQVPAGPTQLFRFIGEARGTAIVSFHHSGSKPPVVDTVVVR